MTGLHPAVVGPYGSLRVIAIVAVLMLQSCAPSTGLASPLGAPADVVQPETAATITATAGPPAPTPQATATYASYGPEQTSFPADINPLTGQRIVDPSLLKVPAVLVSISHFPATGRPQAGFSFAPFVYEFSITGGESRMLTAFYGQWPAPEVPTAGDCEVRKGIFQQTGILLGNRAWLDADGNGRQDPGEEGIPGLCVELYDTMGSVLDRTTTDTNGMFGFNVAAGRSYIVHFSKPSYLDFTKPNVGGENGDSDADPLTGDTSPIQASQDDRTWDAGFRSTGTALAPSMAHAQDPKAVVGPVRSGRLLYAYLGTSYQDSCLIYAFASPEVLSKLPRCSFAQHEVAGGGEMYGIDRLKAVAEDNMRHTASRPFNYSSNLYSEAPAKAGSPALQVNVFFGNLNQSGWTYDPLYQAYLRYVDTADPNARGVLHADVDRLTGRQIHFENLVVLMADTDVVSRTNIDIHLDEGNSGPGMLFRDGQAFPITWSARAGDYERRTGFRRPIQFLNQDGSPAALRPGHTWVIIMSSFSTVAAEGAGVYAARYEAPAGEAR